MTAGLAIHSLSPRTLSLGDRHDQKLFTASNHLLEALPSAAQDRLLPHLEPVMLPLGKVNHEAGAAPHSVCFSTDAIVSLVYVMESGASAESHHTSSHTFETA